MLGRIGKRAPAWVGVAGMAWFALTSPSAQGQFRLFNKRSDCCPPPAMPCPAPVAPPAPAAPVPAAPSPAPGQSAQRPPTEQRPQPEQRPPAAQPPGTPPQQPEQAAQQPQEPSLNPEQSAAVGGESVALASPGMFGDQLSIPAIAFTPRVNTGFPPGSTREVGAAVVPSVRSFKIAEDESPRPRDRVYLGYNYFDDVNAAVNRELGADLHNIRVHRETFGLEKTFLNEDASIGLRLPLNTLTGDSTTPGLGGSDTDIGDLTVILKDVLWKDCKTGSLISAGLAVTAPTGPAHFAGTAALPESHAWTLQPYAGYIWSLDRLYVHGFLAIDVPLEHRFPIMLYNDVGVGYYLYRSEQDCGRLVTAVVPTFEVHINDPLNHRGATNFTDPEGTPDWVTLTAGTRVELGRRATVGVALATPVTGPRPYDFEVLAQFNLLFGGPGRGMFGN